MFVWWLFKVNRGSTWSWSSDKCLLRFGFKLIKALDFLPLVMVKGFLKGWLKVYLGLVLGVISGSFRVYLEV